MTIVAEQIGHKDLVGGGSTTLHSHGGAPPVTIITPSPLDDGTINSVYSVTLAATDGTTPYTWAVSIGALPTGLSLSSAGVISGTPTVEEAQTFTIEVTDNASVTATKEFTLTILAAVTGLIAHWKFDEGSGTTAGDSAGSNTGTLVNGPTWATGQVNGALDFDGVDDFISLPDMGTVESYPFTFSAWYKSSSKTADVLLFQGLASESSKRVMLYFNTDVGGEGRITYNLKNSPNLEVEIIGSDSDGLWHHAVGVSRASNDHELFVDGVSIGTSTNDNGTHSVDTAFIGKSVEANSEFTGVIDEVRIYDRALTNQEVLDLYNEGA